MQISLQCESDTPTVVICIELTHVLHYFSFRLREMAVLSLSKDNIDHTCHLLRAAEAL